MHLHRLIMLSGLIILAGSLSACQNNADRSAASLSSHHVSQSTKSYRAQKPDAAVTSSSKEAQNFHPSAKQTRSKNYVKTGNLKKNGQYTFDSVGTKLALTGIHHPKRTLKSGAFTYHLTTVKFIQNTAENAAAKRMAAQALNLASLKSPYTTIQVKFTIENRSKHALTTDGLKTIWLSADRQLNAANQLSDASAGQTIAPGQKLATFATGLVSQGTTTVNPGYLKIRFAGAFDDRHHQVIKPSGWLTVNL